MLDSSRDIFSVSGIKRENPLNITISMEHRTVILLDCHPETQTLCVKGHDEASNVPSFPLWSCLIEATLEYCRVIFDLFDSRMGICSYCWRTFRT
ncbi:hypothetical protein RclHR1_14890006 [Rhizophagus clarus]|uniref:Uncharacterized protein n=1 Tax=Rhizophagus clarus TaxID=94130 RepID=A0A2Z6R6A6_9GLOM|nr:hypothetical protein RclHR1_14890006 [Rhizophagus clarus]